MVTPTGQRPQYYYLSDGRGKLESALLKPSRMADRYFNNQSSRVKNLCLASLLFLISLPLRGIAFAERHIFKKKIEPSVLQQQRDEWQSKMHNLNWGSNRHYVDELVKARIKPGDTYSHVLFFYPITVEPLFSEEGIFRSILSDESVKQGRCLFVMLCTPEIKHSLTNAYRYYTSGTVNRIHNADDASNSLKSFHEKMGLPANWDCVMIDTETSHWEGLKNLRVRNRLQEVLLKSK